MTFQDIFSSEFLSNMTAVSLSDMMIAMVIAFLLGLFIFFVYRKSYSGVMYSASFGVTMIALTLITTLLIMTVVTNVVLSLGMVGALSIVRFRTAVKEPMDIAFLFWSIAVGIVLAAGMITMAVFGSIFIGAVLYFFSKKKLFCVLSAIIDDRARSVKLNVRRPFLGGCFGCPAFSQSV